MRYGILFVGIFLAAAACLAQSSDVNDAKVLRAAGLSDDGPKLIEYLRRRIVTEADRVKIDELVKQLGHDSFTERERASAAIIQWGLPAVGVLRQAMSNSDVEIARRAETCLKHIEKVPGSELSAAIARAIAKKKPEGAVGALLTFLPVADDETVAGEIREALAAMAAPNGKADAELLTALDDPLPLRRGAAGEALIRANVADARRLMTDPDVEVRMRVVLAAVTRAKDKTAVASLINLLAEVSLTPGWRAEEVLVRLAGDQAPTVSLGKDEGSRKRCRDAWNEWWIRAAASTDLAKLDTLPRVLGNTLIVQSEQRNTTGQVYEISAAGEVLWRIANLQQPTDAIIHGPDRVLIVEAGNEEVTLRDFRGSVISRKSAPSPYCLQALPNGRVLVVCRGSILEWNERLVKSFDYQRAGGVQDICAACKLANGDYWLVTQQGKIIRVDGKKKETELKDIQLGRVHGGFVGMDALANGHVLIAGGRVATEFDTNGGKLNWSVQLTGQLSSVQRLANGNTLIAGLDNRRVVELDRDKEVVWEYQGQDGQVPRKARRR